MGSRERGDRPPDLPPPHPNPPLGAIPEDTEQYENVERGAEGPGLTSQPHSMHSEEEEEGFNDAVSVTGGAPSQAAILDMATQQVQPLEPDIVVVGDATTGGEGSQGVDPAAFLETMAQVHPPPGAAGAVGGGATGGDTW